MNRQKLARTYVLARHLQRYFILPSSEILRKVAHYIFIDTENTI
jgi:hypothetical protein